MSEPTWNPMSQQYVEPASACPECGAKVVQWTTAARDVAVLYSDREPFVERPVNYWTTVEPCGHSWPGGLGDWRPRP